VDEFPGVVGTVNDDNLNRVGNDGFEVQVPYFEQTFHRHYYGEDPPEQFVRNPKRISGFRDNGNSFSRSSWRPSAWRPRGYPTSDPYYATTARPNGYRTTPCNCKEEPSGRDLKWYPRSSGVNQQQYQYDDPGSQINDKLAPLN